VHTLLAQFTDIHGVAKGKLLPLAQLDEVLAEGAGFAGPSICRHRAAAHRTTLRSTTPAATPAPPPLPWMPGVARIVCDGFVNGQPFDACPRQVLKRAVARLAERGWHLRTGIEPEFFLLQARRRPLAPADAQDRLDKPSYDLRSLPRQQGLPARAAGGAGEVRAWTCCRSTTKTRTASTS
jgi:glutamine synthetase